MSSEGFDELGRCALHAPESWKKENGVPCEAKPTMTLAGHWTLIRFDAVRKVLIATVPKRGTQEKFEGSTIEELEMKISAEFA